MPYCAKHCGIFRRTQELGSCRAWYGMENGQKPGNGKKKWKSKWKTAPSWTGAKMVHFLGHFLPFLPLSSLGPFSISISICFFAFLAFESFACHASPAGSQTQEGLWRSRRRKIQSQQPFSLPESAQTLAGIGFALPENRVNDKMLSCKHLLGKLAKLEPPSCGQAGQGEARWQAL